MFDVRGAAWLTRNSEPTFRKQPANETVDTVGGSRVGETEGGLGNVILFSTTHCAVPRDC